MDNNRHQLTNKEIIDELIELNPEDVSTIFLTGRFKIGITRAQEILKEYNFIKSNSQRFGYARISTKEQNEGRQIEEFKKLGIPERNIFIDKQTGRNFNREKYLALKQIMRKGDILYIVDLKRFGRNYKENEEQFKDITKVIGADIIAINTPIINTTVHKDLLGTLITDIILSVLSYETQSDYEQRRLDQRQGIDLWKKTGQTKTGRPYGRPRVELPEDWNSVIKLVENDEITKVEAMKRLNLKKNKFYEFYNEYVKK